VACHGFLQSRAQIDLLGNQGIENSRSAENAFSERLEESIF
jgi:hypothetical protein